jgi:hypothetical protein
VIRVARPAKALVAEGEGLVDQYAARGQGVDEAGEQGPVKVIDDDDAIEAAARDRPGRGFEIGGDDFQACAAVKVGQVRDVDIDGDDPIAAIEQGDRMTTRSAGEVEDHDVGPHQAGEPVHPGRRRGPLVLPSHPEITLVLRPIAAKI